MLTTPNVTGAPLASRTDMVKVTSWLASDGEGDAVTDRYVGAKSPGSATGRAAPTRGATPPPSATPAATTNATVVRPADQTSALKRMRGLSSERARSLTQTPLPNASSHALPRN